MLTKSLLGAGALALSVTLADAAGTQSRKVEFDANGVTLVGTLHLPEGHKPGEKLPGLLVTGSWTTVKEQMPDGYAREMAKRGFAALTFDFTGYGESGGAVRNVESASLKVADLKAATAALMRLPDVDPGRVGGLAICASAGYMAQAINEGAPLKAFASIAGWFHNSETVGLIYGEAEGVASRIEMGKAARAAFETTGKVDYVKAYDSVDPAAAMSGPFDYYARAERGAIQQWANQFAVMAWVEWLTYDSVAQAKALKVPSMFVHGDNVALPMNVKAIYEAIAAPKELVWSQTTAHLDFYDRPEPMKASADAVARHFKRYL